MLYADFKNNQLQQIRKSVNTALEKSGYTTFHEILKNQEFDEQLLNDSTWCPISRKGIYSIINRDANPTIETIMKVCFLLNISFSELLTLNEKDDENE